MRLLIPLLLVASLLVGCSGGASTDDGSKNPPAKRLTEAEFDAQRTKKGEDSER